jgi:tetratricopeptide (TPR) repeat protein
LNSTKNIYVGPKELLDVPKLQRFRRDLLASAQGYYERFLVDSGDDPALLAQTARSALDMVFVEGELGHVDAAARESVRAVELARQLLAHRPGDLDAELLLCEVLMTRGRVQQMRSELDDAMVSLDEARRIGHDVLRRHPRHPQAIAHVLGVERGAAVVLKTLGRNDEAEVAYRALDTMWVADGAALDDHPSRHYALDHVICSLADEARFYVDLRRFDAARAAIDLLTMVASKEPVDSLPITGRIALARLAATRSTIAAADGDPRVQEECLHECLRIADEVLADNPEHANALRTRSSAYNSLGLLMLRQPARAAEGLPWLRKSLQVLRQLLAADPNVFDSRLSLAATLVNLGSIEKDGGDPQSALAYFDEAEVIARACCAQTPERTDAENVLYNATWFVGQTHGDRRDHDRQVAAAQRLAALRPTDGKTQRIAASLVAQALVSLRDDGALAATDRASRRAELETLGMAMLQQAAEHGCIDSQYLREHADMTALRGLPGYAEVVRRVEANGEALRR